MKHRTDTKATDEVLVDYQSRMEALNRLHCIIELNLDGTIITANPTVLELLGYTLKEVVYTFSDVHIYESQYDKVKELLDREPRRLGTVLLKSTCENIKDYRPDDFVLRDYDPHPKMLIPTPV